MRGPRAGDGAVFLGEYRFEPGRCRLVHAGSAVTLRPKTAAVLSALIARAGEVVEKRELIEAVWPDGYIGDVALSVCINELRRALGDDAHRPHYIATQHRRGYSLVAEVSATPQRRRFVGRPFVGRTAELARLTQHWERALTGELQTVFVAAQAGVGKTALVDAFVDSLPDRLPDAVERPLVVRGQCVRQIGVAEPYLPVLQLLAGLWRGPAGAVVAQILSRYAAGWLVQLPGLFTDPELALLRVRAGHAAAPRLQREFAVAMEQLSLQRPLVLVLEDLHDGDRATTELVSYLARRREPARLMVIATYRPPEVIARAHPLHAVVQDLLGRRLADRLALELLSASDVSRYLTTRLAPLLPSATLVRKVLRRTEGNALFLAAVCDHLLAHDLLVTSDRTVDLPAEFGTLGVPTEVRAMLERQVDALDEPDRQLLTAAAAEGVEFSTEIVGAALSGAVPRAELERRCHRLAVEGGLLVALGAQRWPDATVTSRYRFRHEMYRDVLYQRVEPAHRLRLHRRIGRRLITAYGAGAADRAVELAMHLELGQDPVGAASQYIRAGTVALSRSAYPEALDLVGRGLALLDRVDDIATSSRLELDLRRIEVVAAAATWRWREPGARDSCRRLGELAAAAGDVRARLAALLGLHNMAMLEGDDAGMSAQLAEVDAVAGGGDVAACLVADLLHLRADSRTGRFAAMEDRAGRMLATYRPYEHSDLAVLVGDELDVAAHLNAGIALWHLGHPGRAREHAEAALDGARLQAIPAGLARALWFAAVIHLMCGDADRVQALATELDRLCLEHELSIWRAGAVVLSGWAIARLGDHRAGLARVRTGAADWAGLVAIGESLHQRLLAEVCLEAGEVAVGLQAVRAGLAAVEQGYGYEESEFFRLKGELLLLADDPSVAEAERCLTRALELAGRGESRAFQLRAAVALASLRLTQGRTDEARELLAVGTGFDDSPDLLRARELLRRL